MSSKMSEQELLNRLADLPREISPGRDPWPGISAAIANSPAGSGAVRSRHNRWYLAAAASVLIVVSAGLLLKPVYEEHSGATSPSTANKMTLVAGNEGPYGNTSIATMLNSVDAEYIAAFREFVSAGDSRTTLAPQTAEKIELGWADLRMTEQALAAALEQHPDNLFLNERMLELRARQLGFLKQIVSLDRNNRRLTI